MRIGINIDSQFGNMTGIEHYIDSLIGSLYHLESSHDICAFASNMPSRDSVEAAAKTNPGTFMWRDLPQAHLDVANGPGTLVPPGFQSRHPWLTSQIQTHETRIASRLPGGPARRSRKYDVIHSPDPVDMRFEAYRPQHEVATIYDIATRVCPWAYSPRAIAVWEQYWKWAKDRCGVILAISEATRKDASEALGIPEDRFFVTPLAARVSCRRMPDGPERTEILRTWDLQDRPFILYAGTLEPRKNLETLVRAFASLVKQEPDIPHILVLAGGNWKRLDIELRIIACEEDIAGRVLTTGYVTNDELNALMSACDAFVYVSQYEGFGLPPLEAMVCGAPVILSDTSSMPEVAGDAGMLVSPKDETSIGAAIYGLLTNSDENARRRKLSLARAAQFSWERTAELTLRAYEAAANS